MRIKLDIDHVLKTEVNNFFSEKGQVINIFSFVDHRASLATSQLCCCRAKAVEDKTT